VVVPPPVVVPPFVAPSALEYNFSSVTNYAQFTAKIATIPGATTTMNVWQGNYGSETHGVLGAPVDGEIRIPLPSTHNKFTLDIWEVGGLYWNPEAYLEVVLQGSMPNGWTVSDSTPRQIVSNYNVGSTLVIREIGAAIVSKSLNLRIEYVPTGTS
jgi:hypothetical protein